ncbi:MAG: ATP-binding protein [Aristaeellaceae bacterium]
MLLPKEKTSKAKRFEDEITLIYGDPKIGKSTFCSGFENALFLDSETGLSNLSVYRVGIDGWETFIETYKELRDLVKAGKCPYKPLVFDTIDNIYQFCADYVCKKNGLKHPSDLDYGKGWNMVRTEFNTAMQAYKSLDLGVIYVSHADGTEVKTRTGSYTRYDVSMSGQANKVIVPSCDIIMYAHSVQDKDGVERRVLETKPSAYWNAGDKTGKLPETLPLNAAEFIKAFNEAIK